VTLAEMSRRRAEQMTRRRMALLEDLDWMRVTGEHPARVLERLARGNEGYRFSSLKNLVRSLTRAPYPPERAEQLAAVLAWLAPPREP